MLPVLLALYVHLTPPDGTAAPTVSVLNELPVVAAPGAQVTSLLLSRKGVIASDWASDGSEAAMARESKAGPHLMKALVLLF